MNEYIPCLWKERIILSNNLYRFNFNDCGFDTHSASILPHSYFGIYPPYTRLLTLSKGKEIVNSTFFFGRIHGVSKIRNILGCKCDTIIWFFFNAFHLFIDKQLLQFLVRFRLCGEVLWIFVMHIILGSLST